MCVQLNCTRCIDHEKLENIFNPPSVTQGILSSCAHRKLSLDVRNISLLLFFFIFSVPSLKNSLSP